MNATFNCDLVSLNINDGTTSIKILNKEDIPYCYDDFYMDVKMKIINGILNFDGVKQKVLYISSYDDEKWNFNIVDKLKNIEEDDFIIRKNIFGKQYLKFKKSGVYFYNRDEGLKHIITSNFYLEVENQVIKRNLFTGEK